MRKRLTRLMCIHEFINQDLKTTLAHARLSRLDQVEVFILRNVGPARRVTLSSKKGDSAWRVILLVEPKFSVVSHVNSFQSFVRKCGKVDSPRVARVGK